MLCFQCPDKKEVVRTSIETTKENLLRLQNCRFSISVWCPLCQDGHQISSKDAFVSTAAAA